MVDSGGQPWYDTRNFIENRGSGSNVGNELTESPGRWKPGRNEPSNGPLRARGKGRPEYHATRGHASVAGDVLASHKEHLQ